MKAIEHVLNQIKTHYKDDFISRDVVLVSPEYHKILMEELATPQKEGYQILTLGDMFIVPNVGVTGENLIFCSINDSLEKVFHKTKFDKRLKEILDS